MRLVIWNNNDGVRLHSAWEFGARNLFRCKFDYVLDGYTWDEVCEFLGKFDVGHFSEIQYWGHGSMGRAVLGGEALQAKHLKMIGVSLKSNGVLWLRCCAVFGGKIGKQFAANAAKVCGRTVAAYTYNIGYFQSGLHAIRPGEQPWWGDNEGVGTDGKSIGSGRTCPNTIRFFNQYLPDFAFDK